MQGQLKAILDSALDVMSTRIGVAISLIPLIILSVWAGIYVQDGLERLEAKKRLFAERQFRNGFAAMNDVQRLNLVSMEAVRRGGMDAEQAEAFRVATDFLYVRVGTFENSGGGFDTLPEGQQAVADLARVLSIAEGAIENGFSDVERLTVCANAFLALTEHPGNSTVRKALALPAVQLFFLQRFQRRAAHILLAPHEVLDLGQKPGVDAGQRLDLVEFHPLPERVRDVQDTLGPCFPELALEH